MTYHLSSPGWFGAANGHKVIHHALPPSLMSHATTWAEGSPRQLGFHYQGGCGTDLFGTEEARGYPIAALSVDSTGTIHQYGDVERAAWHAYDVSRYAIGVEHAANPGHECELNDRQLEASAALYAALIEYVQDHHGVHIPVRHTGPITPGNYKTVMGVWGHTDIEHGSFLNPTTHVDTLYHWTWERYLGRVKDHLQTVTAPAYPDHVLRRGADERAVITAKRRLHLLGARGFDLGPHFGLRFEIAVQRFQQGHHLATDGAIGPATWATMWKAQP